MLRIGKLTDYAMLILSQMATNHAAILSATFLADVLHLPATTVSKILKMLSDAGLVKSVRGADGGYRLSRPGNEISVADVIAAMEGDLAMTECCDIAGSCTINSSCNLRENWQIINKMIHSLLSKFTIINMTEPLTIKSLLTSANVE